MELTFIPEAPWQTTSNALTPIFDATWKAEREKDPPRQYLGASMIGRHCEREIAFSWHKTPKDPDKGFSGQLYRIFDRGHAGEDRVAKYLRTAGFQLVTHRQDGSQFGFSTLGGRFAGHIDGAITGGPTVPAIGFPYPALWENKILNNAAFGALWNHGLKESKPEYYAQVNIYMAYMQLQNCIFTAENADTCEIFTQVLRIDTENAQFMSDRAVRIVASANPFELARCTTDPCNYHCRLCDYAKTCWSDQAAVAAGVAPAVPKPKWLG